MPLPPHTTPRALLGRRRFLSLLASRVHTYCVASRRTGCAAVPATRHVAIYRTDSPYQFFFSRSFCSSSSRRNSPVTKLSHCAGRQPRSLFVPYIARAFPATPQCIVGETKNFLLTLLSSQFSFVFVTIKNIIYSYADFYLGNKFKVLADSSV